MEAKQVIQSNGAQVENRAASSGATTNRVVATAPFCDSQAVAESKLNPLAAEWDPINNRAPEDDRCCFLTFSNGYPLAPRQIARFFTACYGECVERVYIHDPEPREDRPPLFGKVIFHSVVTPWLVLRGKQEIKFMVDGRPLWCKRFDKDRPNRGAYYN